MMKKSMIPDTLSFMAVAYKGNALWCSNLNFNGLFSISLPGYEIDYKGRFFGYDDYAVGLHRFAEVFGDKLIFFPNYSSSVDTYDVNGNMKQCVIESWRKQKNKDNFTGCAGVFLYKDVYYLFPRFCGMNLIVYDPCQNEIVREIELKRTNDLLGNMKGSYALRGVLTEDCVYMPISGANKIIKYDLNTMEESFVTLPDTESVMAAIEFDGSCFWVHCDDTVKRFDFDFRRVINNYRCIDGKDGVVTGIIYIDSRVYVIPAYLNSIKMIDMKENIIRRITIDTNTMRMNIGPVSKWRHTDNSVLLGEKLFIPPVGLNCGTVLDLKSFTVEHPVFKVPAASIPIKNYREKINYEFEKDDLSEFLFFLKYHC